MKKLDSNLIHQHAGFVRAVARRLVRDEAAVDDVVQQTWITTLERPPRSTETIRSWLYQVVQNIVRQDWRSGERRKALERRTAKPESRGDAESFQQLETGRVLLDAIGSLTEAYREAIVLRYYEDCPPREIAKRLDIPLETVKSRLKRGLAQLRTRLDSKYGGDRRAWVAGLAAFLHPQASLSTAQLTTGGAGSVSTTAAVALHWKLAAVVAVLLGIAFFWWQLRAESQPENLVASVSAGEAGRAAAMTTPAGSEADPSDAPVVPAAPADRSRIEADRDLDLFGTVSDASGRAIPGARVTALRSPAHRIRLLDTAGESRVERAETCVTDDAGAFVLRLSRGDIVDLEVAVEGFATTVSARHMAGERVDLTIRRGSDLEIVVRDETGGHVAGAKILFRRADLEIGMFDFRRAETDEHGRAVLENLAPGWAGVVIEHDRYVGVDQGIEVPLDRALELTLEAGRSIHGHVIDLLSRAPIAGARVGIGLDPDKVSISGEEGRFVYHGWKGDDALTVTAAGYGTQMREVPLEDEVLFEIFIGFPVTGRVLDSRGLPVAGARVTAVTSQWADYRAHQDRHEKLTDGAGRFRLEGLRQDIAQTLVFEARGCGRYHLDIDATLANGTGVADVGDVQLPDALRIEGTALDAQGVPLPRCVVELRGSNEDRDRLMGGSGALSHEAEHAEDLFFNAERRRTDDLGRFRFPGLSPGSYELTLERPGMMTSSRSVRLEEGRSVEDLIIRFHGGADFVVLVDDDEGAAVEYVTIEASVNGRVPATCETDADGRAVFHGLPGRDVEFRIRQMPIGFEWPGRVTVDVAQRQQLSMVVQRASMIWGTAVTSVGEPLGLVGLEVVDAESGKRFNAPLKTDRHGGFVIKQTPGTLLDIRLTGESFGVSYRKKDEPSLWRGEILGLVAEAGTHEIVLRAHRKELDGELRVRVLDGDGFPVPDCTLQIAGPTIRKAHSRVPTDMDGRLVIDDITDEPVEITRVVPPANQSKPWISPAPIRMTPNGREVEIVLSPGVWITGTAFDSDGATVAGLEITAKDAGGFRRSLQSDIDGRFRLAVPSGGRASFRGGAWSDDDRWMEGRIDDATESAEAILRLHYDPDD